MINTICKYSVYLPPLFEIKTLSPGLISVTTKTIT
jgi:hypothetical protein